MLLNPFTLNLNLTGILAYKRSHSTDKRSYSEIQRVTRLGLRSFKMF